MAIEFAFILPILIVILAGMIQFGLAFFLQNNMVNAAREAARQLAVGDATVAGASPTAEAVATGYLAGWGGMTFTVTACDPDNAGANCAVGTDDVAVEITVPRSQVAVADILGIFGSGTMKAKVAMRKE